MITAIALIDADVAQVPEVAEKVAAVQGVTEVFSVTGDVDLIAIVRVPRHEDLAEVVTHRIRKVPGVTGTRTHIAFRTYSRGDLESAFSLGAED